MSIEKLNSESRSEHEEIPFAQIARKVILEIKNGDAFLVWCYLQSKTKNWKVIKQDIKNRYGFGDKKLKKIFAYLQRACLIDYVQNRCANGDFARIDIRVLCGDKFNADAVFSECVQMGGSIMAPPINGTTANDELLKKEVTKERKEQDKESNSATDVAPERNEMTFDEFWKIYPIKKNKVRSKKIWDREKFASIVTLICCDVLVRVKHEPQWQQPQFIPHPATYLGNKLWTDEVTEASTPKKSSGGKSSSFDQYQADLQKQNRGETYEHGAIPQ
jgi:DNA replication protein DnaC